MSGDRPESDDVVVAGSSRMLGPSKRILCEVDDDEVAIFNVNGKLYAISNVCPHQHSPVLIEGELEGRIITCPMHGWKFDLATGKGVDMSSCVRTYTVEQYDDEIRVRKPSAEASEWDW